MSYDKRIIIKGKEKAVSLIKLISATLRGFDETGKKGGVMNTMFTITVHGVKVKWEGAKLWKKDDALYVAKKFLDMGFHLIEIRDEASQRIEVLWTVRDKE